MTDKKCDKVYWDQFKDSLCRSIKNIESRYFQVIRYEGLPTWRERVYCYELYHQLRNYLPKGFPYTLHGEIDKRGQEIICKEFEKKPNPDFVVHQPGTKENLVIMEVKSSVGISEDKIRKDMEKLKTFIDIPIGYKNGIFLVYGSEDPCLEHDLMSYQQLIHENRLHILWHKEVQKSPYYYRRNKWVRVDDWKPF